MSAADERNMPTIHVAGNVNVDLIMGVLSTWPEIGTETILDQSELRVGGSAGNTALALSALGSRFRLIASRGADVFGQWLADRFGADAFEGSQSDAATTISVGIVDAGGDRTFLTTAGHLDVWPAAEILMRLETNVKPGDLVMLSGVFLSPRVCDGYDAILASLQSRGAVVALDTGWPVQGWDDAVRARVMGWLRTCRYLLFNEVEVSSLTGSRDIEKSSEMLLANMGEEAVVVVKRGPLGAEARSRSGKWSVPAPQVRVIDTIGAGDIFNAGFLHACQRGLGLDEALKAAVALASQAISTQPRKIGLS